MKASRLAIFGVDMSKKKPTLGSVAGTWAANRGRRLIGLPDQTGHTAGDWLKHQLSAAWAALFNHSTGPQLPADLPGRLYAAIDETLRNRGGMADKENAIPNFWADATGTISTPFFWSILVNYAPTADPGKVASFELALEDAITRAGYDLNVRIQYRPLRIEIDKPTPPTVTLAELWPQVTALQTNARLAVLGMASTAGRTSTMFISLEGEDFSAFVAGSPGSGKTQLCESILLSLAMTNSPQSLAMVIVDPKAIDFRPFNVLPHLAIPVINEPSQACEVIQWLCDEMDKRTRQAARGDTSFLAHSILLYVDELSDLIASLPDAQASDLIKNIQRLGQKGRGVGFVVIGATQRVYDIDAKAHSKLNVRLVGKMRTAGDSVAASGIPGTATNKLPGRGSFELYSSDQTGTRIQAPFVAASDKPGYEKALAPFFASIVDRWKGNKPGWAAPTAGPAVEPDQQTHQATSRPTEAHSKPAKATLEPLKDQAFIDAMIAAYAMLGDKFSTRTVRDIHKRLYGTEPRNDKAERLKAEFITMHATNIAMQ